MPGPTAATQFDFIEFHDGQIERIDRRAPGEVVIIFGHLYACIRRDDDHAGWSYRAELVLTGVSKFEIDGERDDDDAWPMQGYVSDGEVLDRAGAPIDPRTLLEGSDASALWIDWVGRDRVRIRADSTHAKLVLVNALRRIDDCNMSPAG